jgi:hypothetical protein
LSHWSHMRSRLSEQLSPKSPQMIGILRLFSGVKPRAASHSDVGPPDNDATIPNTGGIAAKIGNGGDELRFARRSVQYSCGVGFQENPAARRSRPRLNNRRRVPMWFGT